MRKHLLANPVILILGSLAQKQYSTDDEYCGRDDPERGARLVEH
jgi:hypothetical protein